MQTPGAANLPASICDGDYTLIQEIGAGAQGAVGLYTEKTTSDIFAVKFDPLPPYPQNVLTECLFLKKHSQGKERLPLYKIHATIEGRRFLIMKYFEQSLHDYIEQK